MVFCLAYYNIQQSIYLGYNDIANDMFQYCFPRRILF